MPETQAKLNFHHSIRTKCIIQKQHAKGRTGCNLRTSPNYVSYTPFSQCPSASASCQNKFVIAQVSLFAVGDGTRRESHSNFLIAISIRFAQATIIFSPGYRLCVCARITPGREVRFGRQIGLVLVVLLKTMSPSYTMRDIDLRLLAGLPWRSGRA